MAARVGPGNPRSQTHLSADASTLSTLAHVVAAAGKRSRDGRVAGERCFVPSLFVWDLCAPADGLILSFIPSASLHVLHVCPACTGDEYEIVRALFCAGGDRAVAGTLLGYTLDTTSTRPSSVLAPAPGTLDHRSGAVCGAAAYGLHGCGCGCGCGWWSGWFCRYCNEKGRGPSLKDQTETGTRSNWRSMTAWAQEFPGRGFCLPQMCILPLSIFPSRCPVNVKHICLSASLSI